MSLDLVQLTDEITRVALAAGQKILVVYGTDFRVNKKIDTSPITEADRLANHTIIEALTRITPDIPIVSEEGEMAPLSVRKQWPYVWLIDPLDGTREFIKRNGEFTVNIALIHEHTPVLGVVYVPVSSVCYFASRGQGAFKRKGKGRATRIQVRAYDRSKSMVVTGSRSHNTNDAIQQLLNHLGPTRYLPMGSALKSCIIAEGGADLYPRFGPTGEWDTAAAQCVVEEAGGGFTDLKLSPLRYNARETLLNPNFIVFGDKSFDWRTPLAQSKLDRE